MEKNTVLLALEEYNMLRDFKESFQKGHTLKVYNREYKIMTTEETVKTLIEEQNKINEHHSIQVNDLLKQIYELNQSKEIPITVRNDLKKMSYWGFCKWRKSLK